MSAEQALHSDVQRWIYNQGWSGLRPIQAQAVPPILSGKTDLLIAAATAGGKTEAAFLPILSHLLSHPGDSIRVLGISPLKALINDQYRRLSEMGDTLGLQVTAWHGDISSGRKKKVIKNPQGIVIITPESLEAMLALRGPALPKLFAQLDYFVIDEMHVFIGSERGRQLQSLMNRLEQVLDRFIPRIGLSATLGDMNLAAEFLRPGKAKQVQCINPPGSGGDLRLQLKGYRRSLADQAAIEAMASKSLRADATSDDFEIAMHLFKAMRGSNNLIFVNGRANVEKITDLLREESEHARVPNEFFPHHGSLSKDLREDVEDFLRSDLPSNVVCTTTLEMGIDVGDVKSVAQVGAPFSVASMRQRIGRSGRRKGEPTIARFYVSVPELAADVLPQDAIHPELVQTIAIINLLLNKWCEPPAPEQLQLSTLIQQIFSLLSQYQGLRADEVWSVLCESGPFQQISDSLFRDLLRCMGQRELIQQSGDRTLLLSPKGERIASHYSFYSAFNTDEDYRLLYQGKPIGTLPQKLPFMVGMRIVFAGQRWLIEAVDEEKQTIEVVPTSGGRVPKFSGGGGNIHSRVRQTMYELYCSTEVPGYLDSLGKELLQEARQNFKAFGLDQNNIIASGKQSLIFCWQGDIVLNTILAILVAKGVKASRDGVAISVSQCNPGELFVQLNEWTKEPELSALDLAANIKNKRIGKYDHFLSQELLSHNYASSQLDAKQAWQTMHDIVKNF